MAQKSRPTFIPIKLGAAGKTASLNIILLGYTTLVGGTFSLIIT
jgi:hypothetical protein